MKRMGADDSGVDAVDVGVPMRVLRRAYEFLRMPKTKGYADIVDADARRDGVTQREYGRMPVCGSCESIQRCNIDIDAPLLVISEYAIRLIHFQEFFLCSGIICSVRVIHLAEL